MQHGISTARTPFSAGRLLVSVLVLLETAGLGHRHHRDVDAASASSAGAGAVASKDRGASLGLQCPPCHRIHCSPRRPAQLKCRGGIATGICNCCPVCAKLAGERCGGQWNYLGKCDAGLYCEPDANQVVIDNHVDRPPSRASSAGSPDVWTPEGECRKGENPFTETAIAFSVDYYFNKI